MTTGALSPWMPEPPREYRSYDQGGGEIAINWHTPQGTWAGSSGWVISCELLDHLVAIIRRYAGDQYLLPVLPPMKRSQNALHPLMAWWAVLYTLSMLARYEPATWGTLINVDTSKYAVPIERLLERAINHLPVLIADAIAEVSA